MSVQQIRNSVTINTSGSYSRLERGYVSRRTNTQYIHVTEPVMIQRPVIEDFNNLIVVHDTVEQYV